MGRTAREMKKKEEKKRGTRQRPQSKCLSDFVAVRLFRTLSPIRPQSVLSTS